MDGTLHVKRLPYQNKPPTNVEQNSTIQLLDSHTITLDFHQKPLMQKSINTNHLLKVLPLEVGK